MTETVVPKAQEALRGLSRAEAKERYEALSLPTEESATIAVRTQQIILHESGVANTVDPVGGSYAVEHLTNRLEAEATALLARIDGAGGTLAAIESGFIQQQIQDSAYQAQQAIDSSAAVVVGALSGVGAGGPDGVPPEQPASTSRRPAAIAIAFMVFPPRGRQSYDGVPPAR